MKDNLKVEKYVNKEISLDVKVDYEKKDVWLSQNDMSILFKINQSAISKHTKNIIEKLKIDISKYSCDIPTRNKSNIIKQVRFYNLFMITEIGKKVKSDIIFDFKNWVDNLFMNIDNNKNIIANNLDIVRFIDGEFYLDVSVSYYEDTVWLTQEEIALLFEVTVPNISYHISKIFKDGEINKASVVKEILTTASDGKSYLVTYYNLDMILSIGYRVNSKRGVEFRKWASSILKNYLINGYSINEKKCLECKDNIISLNNKVEYLLDSNKDLSTRIANLENIEDVLKEKLFYENNIYEPYSFIKDLFNNAQNSIIIIDGYIDKTVLDMLNEIKTPIEIYTLPNAPIKQLDITKFQNNHSLNIIKTKKCHDRFIIIDETVYITGSSIKDIGKKISYIIKTSFNRNDIINNLL